MNLWTFLCVIIIIGVIGDALKKAFQGVQSKKDKDSETIKINELMQRISELENRSDIKVLEKRIEALETIIVDSDYILDMKFKKAMG